MQAFQEHPQKNGAELVAPPEPLQRPHPAIGQALAVGVALADQSRQVARRFEVVTRQQVCARRRSVPAAHDARQPTGGLQARQLVLADDVEPLSSG